MDAMLIHSRLCLQILAYRSGCFTVTLPLAVVNSITYSLKCILMKIKLTPPQILIFRFLSLILVGAKGVYPE